MKKPRGKFLLRGFCFGAKQLFNYYGTVVIIHTIFFHHFPILALLGANPPFPDEQNSKSKHKYKSKPIRQRYFETKTDN